MDDFKKYHHFRKTITRMDVELWMFQIKTVNFLPKQENG